MIPASLLLVGLTRELALVEELEKELEDIELYILHADGLFSISLVGIILDSTVEPLIQDTLHKEHLSIVSDTIFYLIT